METPLPENLNIDKYRHDLEVIRNTANQVIKDFELFGIEITFSGSEQMAYDELAEQIIPVLTQLYKNETSKFIALLYRIDVNEEKANGVMNNFSGKHLEEELSKLIIEREFVKTLYKKFYL